MSGQRIELDFVNNPDGSLTATGSFDLDSNISIHEEKGSYFYRIIDFLQWGWLWGGVTYAGVMLVRWLFISRNRKGRGGEVLTWPAAIFNVWSIVIRIIFWPFFVIWENILVEFLGNPVKSKLDKVKCGKMKRWMFPNYCDLVDDISNKV